MISFQFLTSFSCFFCHVSHTFCNAVACSANKRFFFKHVSDSKVSLLNLNSFLGFESYLMLSSNDLDINECSLPNPICGSTSDCSDNIGSYSCACHNGYETLNGNSDDCTGETTFSSMA